MSDTWGGSFANALAAIRNSNQQRALYQLDQQARQGYGQAIQDPSLFQGSVPGATPMQGSPDAHAYGGAPGGQPDMSQPRGIRNNNPGNISDSPWMQRQPGYAGTDGRFARFDTRQNGDQAVNSLLQNYATQGINTVSGIIGKWAPPNENSTQDYINFVSRAVGADPNAPLTPDQRLKLAPAIAQFENGLKASQSPGGGMSTQPPGPGAIAQGGPGGMTPPQPGQAPGILDQRQAASTMAQPGVGMDTARFSGGTPPPTAGQGGTSDGSPPGVPPTGQGAPALQGGQQATGGLDMSRIIAAVQRANPGAKPEIVGEVVKRFLPILTGERAQGNTEQTFQAGRQDAAQRAAESQRNFEAQQAEQTYQHNKPVVVPAYSNVYRPDTGEIVQAGRPKLDAGSMAAVRAADTGALGAQKTIDLLQGVLKPDPNKGGQSLNDRAYSGWFAAPRGYAVSQFERTNGPGTATEDLSNIVTKQALDQLKDTFGGRPSDREGAVLQSVAGSVSKSPQERKLIYQRAIEAAQQKLQFYKDQAEQLRGGNYYQPGGAAGPNAAGADGSQVIDGVTIRRVK